MSERWEERYAAIYHVDCETCGKKDVGWHWVKLEPNSSSIDGAPAEVARQWVCSPCHHRETAKLQAESLR